MDGTSTYAFSSRLENDIAEIKRNIVASKIPEFSDDPKYIDGCRMKKEFGISDRTLQTWRDNGIIPWCRFQRKIYYPWAEIKAMLESQMQR